jgi:hypothetical protein
MFDQVLRCQVDHHLAPGASGLAALVMAQSIEEGFGQLLGEASKKDRGQQQGWGQRVQPCGEG